MLCQIPSGRLHTAVSSVRCTDEFGTYTADSVGRPSSTDVTVKSLPVPRASTRRSPASSVTPFGVSETVTSVVEYHWAPIATPPADRTTETARTARRSRVSYSLTNTAAVRSIPFVLRSRIGQSASSVRLVVERFTPQRTVRSDRPAVSVYQCRQAMRPASFVPVRGDTGGRPVSRVQRRDPCQIGWTSSTTLLRTGDVSKAVAVRPAFSIMD